MNQYVYVVVTQTGTVLSRLLKVITKADYNHVSLSTDPTLGILYSFGRKNAYNPFWGGFVQESPHFGTFKRFFKTEAVILAIPVSEEMCKDMQKHLETMYAQRNQYRYDTLGLLLASVKVLYVREKTYYCSSFVLDFLKEYGLTEGVCFEKFPKPIEFLNLPGEVIYRGKLQDFVKNK